MLNTLFSTRFFLLLVACAAIVLVAPSSANAGFSINSEPVAPKLVVPLSVKPRLILSNGMSLKVVVTAFVAQYGWSVAWNTKDVSVSLADVFTGASHEEVLADVLRKYKLVADRFPEDRGYAISGQEGSVRDEVLK